MSKNLATKFTPKFLYRDGDYIRNSMKFNEEKIPYLNKCLTNVQELFDRELTLKEKTEILQFGWEKVEEMHRSNSQFPKANIKMLLSLHGINGEVVDNVEKELKEHSSKFRDDIFIVTDTGLEISELYLDKLEQIGNYHTTSEAQNQKLDIISNIAQSLNEAVDAKIIHKHQLQDVIKNTNKLLAYGITPLDNEGFRPNYETIRKL